MNLGLKGLLFWCEKHDGAIRERKTSFSALSVKAIPRDTQLLINSTPLLEDFCQDLLFGGWRWLTFGVPSNPLHDPLPPRRLSDPRPPSPPRGAPQRLAPGKATSPSPSRPFPIRGKPPTPTLNPNPNPDGAHRLGARRGTQRRLPAGCPGSRPCPRRCRPPAGISAGNRRLSPGCPPGSSSAAAQLPRPMPSGSGAAGLPHARGSLTGGDGGGGPVPLRRQPPAGRSLTESAAPPPGLRHWAAQLGPPVARGL